MEAGEKERREAFEEMINNNLKTIAEYAKDTRNLLRESEERVAKLEAIIRSQNQTIESLRSQLAAVQTIVFRGGTV